MHKRKQKLPGWFPIATYTSDLTVENWFEEVMVRLGFQTAHRNPTDARLSRLKPEGDIVEGFTEIVGRGKGPSGDLIDEQAFWPVHEISSFEVRFLAEGLAEDAEEVRWAKELARGSAAAMESYPRSDFYHSRIKVARDEDLLPKLSQDALREVLAMRVPLMIDLDTDDETLVGAFKLWLMIARGITDSEHPRRVDDRALARYKRFQILAAFDLQFWAEINSFEYTDAFVANALWPDTHGADEFVDVTERYRKVTKPLLAEVVNWQYLDRLGRQVSFERKLARLSTTLKVEPKTIQGIPERLSPKKNSRRRTRP